MNSPLLHPRFLHIYFHKCWCVHASSSVFAFVTVFLRLATAVVVYPHTFVVFFLPHRASCRLLFPPISLCVCFRVTCVDVVFGHVVVVEIVRSVTMEVVRGIVALVYIVVVVLMLLGVAVVVVHGRVFRHRICPSCRDMSVGSW